MNVLQAYRSAWGRRAFSVPVILAVRLLSVAVIAPLIGIAVGLGTSLSGQGALTDQDIAAFILSPMGFPVFLGISALVLIGSVIGLAALTIDVRDPGRDALGAISSALRTIAQRFPALLRYAVELVLRVLLIALPFAAVALVAAQWLLGSYDINYYLSARPPQFIAALGLGALLLAGLILLLVPRLLAWAVSLHFVLLGGCSAHASFAASRAAMAGARSDLMRDLAIWLGLRLLLTGLLALVFSGLIRNVPGALGDALGVRLAVALTLVAGWWLSGVLVSAVSLGALARILNARYTGPTDSPAQNDRDARYSLVTPATVSIAIIALLGFGVVTALGLTSRIDGDQEVLVIGHRGAAGDHPENTLASIRAAVEDGADWVEIDVQETADGQVVVIHDSDLMKQASVDLKIWDATMQDLAQIDIGSWFDPAYAQERVPTLAEALELTRDRAVLLIELKYYGHDTDLEARTVAIVEAAGLGDQVAVMSLKYPAVQKMLELRPDWPTGVLAATAVGDLTDLDGTFLAVSGAMASPRLVRQAHAQGKQLFVWTINDPLEMSAMISMGVDGLITDMPALARETIETRARLSPPQRLFLLLLDRFNLTPPDGAMP